MVELPKISRIKNLMISGDLTRLLIYISTGFFIALFLILALLAFIGIINFGSPVDYIIFAFLSGTGIYGMYTHIHHRRIYKIDSILPDFVRDLAASRRAGMTFTKALLFTSKGNYGFLTNEIKKTAQQISWGSSVEEALSAFAKRINTKSVKRTVSLIIEASKSGGNVADVLDVASNDSREIKILERERRVSMASYVVVIYVGMFVFQAIIAILSGVFLPTITGGESQQFAAAMGGRGISQMALVQVFYFATLVQGIGTGLVAGIFEDGHIETSVKHIFIMVLVTWVVFKFLVGA